MWCHWRRKSPIRRRRIIAFIGEGSELEGKCTFSGTVMLSGKFKGNITTTDTLIVGERAVVHATVRAGTAIVNGELSGTVEATERVELKKGARVFSDLQAPVLLVEEGVLFEGHCRSTKSEPREGTRDDSVVPLRQ
ncbi:MAG: polymer-forming cytoskeletal protein [Candidatus Rokubacteria bacterium]|nr:polymer-forming cytoskeletal protein [Candidatus Rokubacteria bacterium]